MYKRLSVLIIIGVIISTLSFTACSGKDSGKDTSSASSVASKNALWESALKEASDSEKTSSASSSSTLGDTVSKAGSAVAAASSAASSKSASSKSQSSSAAVNNGTKMTVKDITAAAGSTVSVPFAITAGSEIAAADVMVYYDSSVISYESYTACSAFSSGGIHAANEISPGQLKLTFATLNPLTTADNMFTVKFKVKGKSGSKTNITPKFETCCKEDTVTKLTVAIDAGSLTVK